MEPTICCSPLASMMIPNTYVLMVERRRRFGSTNKAPHTVSTPGEFRKRRLDLSPGETSAGARVIGALEARIEGDGDVVIGDGAVELSMLLKLTAPCEVGSRRFRA